MAEFTALKPTYERHRHYAPTTDADVRAQRLKDGQCPDCGAQTHRIERSGVLRKRTTKVPLSVAGEVRRGRCLLCHPAIGNDQQQHGNHTNTSSGGMEPSSSTSTPLSHQHFATTQPLAPRPSTPPQALKTPVYVSSSQKVPASSPRPLIVKKKYHRDEVTSGTALVRTLQESRTSDVAEKALHDIFWKRSSFDSDQSARSVIR